MKKTAKVAPSHRAKAAKSKPSSEEVVTRLSDTVTVTSSGAQFVTPVEIIRSPEGKGVLDRLYKQKPELRKIKVQRGKSKTTKSTAAVASSLVALKKS